jgi:hypothetical protein
MKKISKSPDRHSFQKGGYIKRQEEAGEPVNEEYLDMFENIINAHEHKFDDSATHINNMEYDLVTTDWILEKVRASEAYAQNLYASICNNDFIKLEVVPILRQDPDKDYWSASWRSAGGIVADMRQEGDYIDWYCSGIGNDESGYGLDHRPANGYVPEGCITDEIRNDLQRLGWAIVPGGDWEKFNTTGEKVK